MKNRFNANSCGEMSCAINRTIRGGCKNALRELRVRCSAKLSYGGQCWDYYTDFYLPGKKIFPWEFSTFSLSRAEGPAAMTGKRERDE